MAATLEKKWPWQKIMIITITKKSYVIIICHWFHDLIIVLMLFYDACTDIWQQLHICAICLKLRWCNDYCVMVWLGEFCYSIQNYLYNWHSIFLWKLWNLITIQNTLQYSPIFFSLLRHSDSLNHKFYINLTTISELPNEITKYWRYGPRSRVILYSLHNYVLRSFWCLWVTLWVNLLPFTACSHMQNNLHFGICEKQQSPQDSLAQMVATVHI